MRSDRPQTSIPRLGHRQGFNDDQKAAVLATQAAQVEELNQRRAAERNEDLAFCAQQEAIRRTLEVRALQVEDFKLAQNKAAAQFLQQQVSLSRSRCSWVWSLTLLGGAL